MWVESENEEADGPLRLDGDPHLVEQIRAAIANSYGMRGRPLDEEFSPVDLTVALDGRFLKAFEPTEV